MLMHATPPVTTTSAVESADHSESQASNTRYTASGKIPPIASATPTAIASTASDQAYGPRPSPGPVPDAAALAPARKAFDDAQAALKVLDDDLQQELAEIGPAIYNPNGQTADGMASQAAHVQAYIDQFHAKPEYVAAKATAAAAATALGVQLQSSTTSLVSNNEEPVIVATYTALAANPATAFQALQWADASYCDPRYLEWAKQVEQVGELAQDTDCASKLQQVDALMVKAHAAQDATGQVSGLEAVMQFIEDDICAPYATLKTMAGVGQLRANVVELKAYFAIDRAIDAGKEKQALQIATKLFATAPHGMSNGIFRIWSALDAMLGAFSSGKDMLSADNVFAAATAAQQLYESLMALKDLTTAAKSGSADVAKQAQELVEKIGGKADAIDRIFTLAGIVSSGIDLAHDLDRTQKYPDNLALKFEAAADIAGMIGGVLSLFPPLVPLGEAIGALAAAGKLVASLFEGDPEGTTRRSEEQQFLSDPAVLGDPMLAKTFTAPAAAANLAAAQDAGLTSADIASIGRCNPAVFATDHLIVGVDQVMRFLTANTSVGHFIGCAPALVDMLSGLSIAQLETLDWVDIASQPRAQQEAIAQAFGSLYPGAYQSAEPMATPGPGPTP